MIALDAIVQTWYTPAGEEGEEATQFLLKPLSGAEAMELMPLISISNDNTTVILSSDAINFLIKKGLKDWKNLLDSEGVQLKFTPNSIERISLFAIKDLANEIFSRTQIVPETKKKS